MKQKAPVNPIYEANLTALRENYPHIAARVEKAPVSRDFEIRGTGPRHFVNIFCKKQSFYFYKEGNPQQDTAEQMKLLNLKNAKIAVFLGFGLGYEVVYFAREMAAKLGTVKILIIEKDVELFKTALHMFNYVPMMKDVNIKLVVGEAEENLFPIFGGFFKEKSNVIYLKAMKPIYHMSSLKLNKDYYLKALKILRESGLYTLQYFGNSPEDSLIGVENIMDNIHEIVSNPGINLLYNRFAGKPAVIVATGPSLNKNKHLLKGLEDKALIIAADASLRILIDMGVKPHLVASLERVMPTVKLLEGFSREQVEDVYLAACPVVRPEMYQAYPGPRIITYRNFDHFRWLGVDKGILDIKQSAGNMAFKLAEAMGCDPIILIGQDLAYSRDGKTHARGALYGEKQKSLSTEQFEVMGNDGQPILTNPIWNGFRQAYEIDVAGYSGRCINSTEGGAYIQGTEIMTFQAAIDTFIKEEFHPRALIKESLAHFSAEDIVKDIERLKSIIASTKKDLELMKNYCQEALDTLLQHKDQVQNIIKQAQESDLDINIKLLHDEIVRYKDKVLSIQPTLQLFLMHIIQSYHIKAHIDLHELPDLYEDEDQLLAHLVHGYHQWFAVVYDIISICLESLERAETRIDSTYHEL